MWGAIEEAVEDAGFFCPRCLKVIMMSSEAPRLLISVKAGRKSLGKAVKGLIVIHYRHTHTAYDKELKSLGKAEIKRFRKLRSAGLSREEASNIIQSEYGARHRMIKEKYTEEASKLAREDGVFANLKALMVIKLVRKEGGVKNIGLKTDNNA